MTTVRLMLFSPVPWSEVIEEYLMYLQRLATCLQKSVAIFAVILRLY